MNQLATTEGIYLIFSWLAISEQDESDGWPALLCPPICQVSRNKLIRRHSISPSKRRVGAASNALRLVKRLWFQRAFTVPTCLHAYMRVVLVISIHKWPFLALMCVHSLSVHIRNIFRTAYNTIEIVGKLSMRSEIFPTFQCTVMIKLFLAV